MPPPFIFDLDSPNWYPNFFSFLNSISVLILYAQGAGVLNLPDVKSDFVPYPNAAFLLEIEDGVS